MSMLEVVWNGAKFDREYLAMLLDDARSKTWTPDVLLSLPEGEHQHCAVCWGVMTSGERASRSGSDWLCDFCLENLAASL